ncbi:protein of unknown function [Taphrina deformans PYCC 5710]|uniref:Uncharacterized protein n=1 Tax=Taphrina deformans (strain PYCC 5710 / ATCC 11124 / CBS 356.35 / IMI 108563 / JCM 9778 / NBRC 8474) TaxID=1097556 RepID=R4XB12_TAPDE|nr:protein of unknown function [Taphrina deformans PYCC 5710]|eukprot:CCG83013.1 protein of unknown function [Taphrina deformans PYCC 5710]
MQLKPHPSTYILFRPPASPLCDAEEVFHTDIELAQKRTLDYKKSCPALLGTASKQLARISETFDNASDAEEEEPGSEHEARNDAIQMFEQQPTTTKTLNKKRSFLLVDVIDNVEGRAAIKRQDPRDTSSLLSNDSIGIDTPRSVRREARAIKRQKSDFDVLYANSKELVKSCRQFGDKSHENALIDGNGRMTIEPGFRKSGQAELRHRKSMITMSLRSNRSTSPSRTRLDRIDMEELTSFDKLLQEPHTFKTAPADTLLDTKPLIVTSFASGPPLKQIMKLDHPFSHNTELLKQMPATKLNTRSCRKLRHSKSAKEVLQKYSTKKVPNPRTNMKAELPPSPGTDHAAKESVSKKSSIRSGLRHLLGL